MNKHRMTFQRKKILDEMRRYPGHQAAEAIYDHLKAEMPELSLSTVYRSLKGLADIGQVSISDLGDGLVFELINSEPHHHLVCLGCQAVLPLDNAEVTPFFKQIESRGFKIATTHLCLYGYCSACQEKGLFQ